MKEYELDELKLTGALPSPTGVGLSILELTRGEDYAMGDITRAIQSDPALTGRIIKIANSAGFAGSHAVTSVAQAAMRLGVRSVRNVALGFTLVTGNRGGSCVGFDYEAYWARSLAIAVLSQRLAEALRLAAPADAFTCGLLSEIGVLALASIHPDRYAQLLKRRGAEPGADALNLEREIFDLDHCELAAAMLNDWRLPESFCFAVSAFERRDPLAGAPSDAARRMVTLVRAASIVAEICFLGDGRDDRAETRLTALQNELGLSLEDFERLRSAALLEWKEWGRALQIPTDRQVRPAELEEEAQRALAVPTDSEVKRQGVERKGLRILVVDDDPVSLRILEHHLTRDGHQVMRAMNGRQALIMALETAPQMIVTDWNMPEMDGLELAKSLRRSNEARGTYILLVTGREEEDRVVEAFDSGVDEYVVKPFNPKIVLARVRAGQRIIELREQVEHDRQLRDRQVAEMAVLNRKLEAAAMTDVLTNLPNRRFAMRKLDDELNGALASSSPLSVIMIDIDHFKQVNDRFGHDMGDLVLRETASVLRNTTRRGDYVCRLGGEEFLVICTKASLAQCAMTAERIRTAIEENVIGFGFDRAVTISAGAASLDCGAHTVDELLKIADRRVYLAKSGGRNRVSSQDSPPSQARSA
jgi:two-component system cell cycle response regulator